MNSEPDSGSGCAVILIIVDVGISILAIGIGFVLAFFMVDSSDNSSMVSKPAVAERAFWRHHLPLRPVQLARQLRMKGICQRDLLF